ncbi:hypothetical protein [Flaviaesturariibacter terrae]
MKKFLFAASMLLFGYTGFSQATEGSVKVARDLKPAAVIELPYPEDIVTAALTDYLSKKGRSRTDDIKGFITFRNTQSTTEVNGNADLHLKIDRKSRQEKGRTLVSLLLTAPTPGDTSAGGQHYMNMEEAKAFLNGLVASIDAYSLEDSIRDQNALVIKAESRYKSLSQDGASLEQKRLNVEKDIRENKAAIENQDREVTLQKQKLADLVRQRKM